MTTLKKAFAYLRVSSKDQAEGDSLPNQKKETASYAKAQGYKITNVYTDSGISGRSMTGRDQLKQLLADIKTKPCDAIFVYKISRFGRNATQVLQNFELLKADDVKLFSVKEKFDFSSKMGKFILGIFALVADMEAENIAEQSVDVKMYRLNKGIPANGSKPIGRKWNKLTGEWEVDEHKADLLKEAAQRYLQGEGLYDIAKEFKATRDFPISYAQLRISLKDRCADKWTIKMQGETFTFDIPRILDQATIDKIHKKMTANRTQNKSVSDRRNKYLLAGLIKCVHCGKRLTGTTNNDHRKYQYYRHPTRKDEPCKHFSVIKATKVETAVFNAIWEHTIDETGYNQAIKDSMPDQAYIKRLNNDLKRKRKQLTQTTTGINNLIDAVASGAIKKHLIKEKQDKLLVARDQLQTDIDDLKQTLDTLPPIKNIKLQASLLRSALLEYFGSEHRYQEMTFEDKRNLLVQIFDKPDLGVFIERITGTKQWKVFIKAQLFNLEIDPSIIGVKPLSITHPLGFQIATAI